MRQLILLTLAMVLASLAARCETLYARPDTAPAGDVYHWDRQAITESIALRDAIEIAKGANGTRPIEIRLLQHRDDEETVYSLQLSTLNSALRWKGSEVSRLVFRGQVDTSGTSPRPLTTIVGRPLPDTICRPKGVDLCRSGPESSPAAFLSHSTTVADSIEESLDQASTSRAAGADDVQFRLHCFLIWESAYVDVADLGFRDCWFAAVASYASHNVALRRSIIDGSTYAFLAVGKKVKPETAHSFEVTGNAWRQSTSSYRSPDPACDPRWDWSCPVSVWADLPWAVTHHFFWSFLNGALFMGMDVSGNVKIADNYVYDAYNAIRSKLSGACRKDEACAMKTNIGFEISGNFFEKVRDNAVEPETRAVAWIVKHNVFRNVYAAISTDSVSGRDLLVFGNIFSLEEAPGPACRDEGWIGNQQFQAVREGGRWGAEKLGGDDARCGSHTSGTVIKLGGDDAKPTAPLLDRILFFNNSVRTRSPLFRGVPGPAIVSLNNVVQFIGCGASGEGACRQEALSEPQCGDRARWTADRQALFADCFSLTTVGDEPHRWRYNLYNRLPGAELAAFDEDRVRGVPAFDGAIASGTRDWARVAQVFAPPPSGAFENSGCRLRYERSDLHCVDGTAPLGAITADGRPFEVALPFGYPFADTVPQSPASDRPVR
jgi:hypothetical protein